MSVSDDEFQALKRLVEAQSMRLAALEDQLATKRVEDEPVFSRRGLFGAALAGAAAGLAAGGIPKANAADTEPLRVGSRQNIAESPTALRVTNPSLANPFGVGIVDKSINGFSVSAGLAGHTCGSYRAGVLGEATGTGPGTNIDASSVGVFGISSRGYGVSGANLNSTDPLSNGVGVLGTGRIGVKGQSSGAPTPQFIGVLAQASGAAQTALVAKGSVRMSRAGKVKITAGTRQITVAMPDITGTSIVFTTRLGGRGTVGVLSTATKVAAPTGFTITLNGPAPTGDLIIGYVVIDMIGKALDPIT